jgi:hypothetical protein
MTAQEQNEKWCGFYLHTSWEYDYPFAVRSWQRHDFINWFKLLRTLELNHVMIWPLTEAIPAPLSDEDAGTLQHWRQIVEDAKAADLQCWLVFCPNVTARPEIAQQPFAQRHLYPYRIEVRLDDPVVRAEYFRHRAQLLVALNNADGYVVIDGDPGGYPGAQPREYLSVMQHDRKVLDACGREDAELIPWLWGGWGSDWSKNGPWNEPIEPLTVPLIDLIKQEMPEPWSLLPGRSAHEQRANGRINLVLAERAGVIEKSTLLCYEIIEYEPSPPAIVLQFDDIRRVLRQEAPLLMRAQGVIGNAQQPVMALPNLFFFARCIQNPQYSDRENESVLLDLAAFLGGDPELLVPAWNCLQLDSDALSDDLPERLRQSELKASVAALLPGGPNRYLCTLARWVEVRLSILRACESHPQAHDEFAGQMAEAFIALVVWWANHHYVSSGESGNYFQLSFTHPLLIRPLRHWAHQFMLQNLDSEGAVRESIMRSILNHTDFSEAITVTREDATKIVSEMVQDFFKMPIDSA